MGCSGVKESGNEPDNKMEEKEGEEEEKEEEEKIKEDEPKKKSEPTKHIFDEHTTNYFKNFTDEEISLILERKKSIDQEKNFVFLYSKFEIDYTDKKFIKKNTTLCKEYLVCYVNPNYVGNFGYESQIIGFCLEKISLNYCSIQNKKIPAQMRNLGRIVSVLIIEEKYKDKILKDIMVFEFGYNISQLKMHGMRIIDIYYDSKPLTGSISLKYDKNLFSIKSSDNDVEISKEAFFLSNKDKFCLMLIDINYDLSIKKEGSKIGKLIYSKFSSAEIKQINNSLKNMDIKPFKKNIIYKKMVHNLKKNTDFVKGYILIFQPSFENIYFDLCEGIDKSPEQVDFLVHELRINDKSLINIKKLNGKNKEKPENYYESTNTSYRFNIRSNEDFILLEFMMEGIDLGGDKEDVQYSLDAKNLFKFFLNYKSYYKFEIILNDHEVYFDEDETYKYDYKKTDEKIIFEGTWKLKNWNDNQRKKYLPNELIIKKH